MRFTAAVTFATLCLSTAVDAHSVVTEVKGANGINGVGMGVIDVTGQEVGLFNQASRYGRGDASLCGSQRLKLLKPNLIDKDAEVQKAVANGLPTADSNGILSMTIFQVNGDGAGPYTCAVSPSGNDDLIPAEVTTDVPGKRGRSGARNQAFPFDVKVPANLNCTGPGDSCILRCKNAIKQPFGGCVVFGASNSNSTSAPAQGSNKRSLFGRLLVDEDPNDVNTSEVVPYEAEETLDHDTDTA